MKNKRSAPRHAVRQFVAVIDETQTELIGNVIDISESGMRVVSELKAIAVGNKLKVGLEALLDNGDTEHFFVIAQVLWVKLDDDPEYCQVGFRFLKIPPRSMHLIQFMIEGEYRGRQNTGL